MICREVEERLPWFLHDSLSAGERAEVEAHLAGCAGCRAALDATRGASALFAGHLPAEAVVDYALGLPVAGLPRAVVEGHLAYCAECREEIALVGSERAATAAPADAATVAPRTRRAWPLALAASIALAASLSLWFATRGTAPAPQGRVALVELLPEDARTRGAEAAPARLDPAVATTLLLVSDRAETFDEVRARLRPAAGGAALREDAGLLAVPGGAYALLVPAGVAAGVAAGGELLIELEGRLGDEWQPLGRYRVAVAAPVASAP